MSVSEVRALRVLVDIDPELAYLAVLTLRGTKPLSRWEETLSEAASEQLTSLGFRVQSVPRHVERGRVTEAVFSPSRDLVSMYRSRFEGQPVTKTADVARIEGFLFGYPGCCVEAFVRRPYVANGLAEADQRILFHWACPGCSVTPLLIPHYRWAHGVIEQLSPGFGPPSDRRQ